jgi:quercetin dioxygenase-like cupin family protein
MNTINLKDVKVKALPGRDVYVLTEQLATKNLTVGICEVPPKSTMVPHKHVQEETIFILQGNGHVVVNGEKESVCPGTLIHFPSNLEHFTANETDETMRFVFIFSPTVIVGSYG